MSEFVDARGRKYLTAAVLGHASLTTTAICTAADGMEASEPVHWV